MKGNFVPLNRYRLAHKSKQAMYKVNYTLAIMHSKMSWPAT